MSNFNRLEENELEAINGGLGPVGIVVGGVLCLTGGFGLGYGLSRIFG